MQCNFPHKLITYLGRHLNKLINTELYTLRLVRHLLPGFGDPEKYPDDDVKNGLSVVAYYISDIKRGAAKGREALPLQKSETFAAALSRFTLALYPKDIEGKAKQVAATLTRNFDREVAYHRREYFDALHELMVRYLNFILYDLSKSTPEKFAAGGALGRLNASSLDSINCAPARLRAENQAGGSAEKCARIRSKIVPDHNGEIEREPNFLADVFGDQEFEVRQNPREYFKVRSENQSIDKQQRRAILSKASELPMKTILGELMSPNLAELFRITPSILARAILLDGLGGGDWLYESKKLHPVVINADYIRQTKWMTVSINQRGFEQLFSSTWANLPKPRGHHWYQIHFLDFLGAASAAILTEDARWLQYRETFSQMIICLKDGGAHILRKGGPAKSGSIDSFNFVELIKDLTTWIAEDYPGAKIKYWFEPYFIKIPEPKVSATYLTFLNRSQPRIV